MREMLRNSYGGVSNWIRFRVPRAKLKLRRGYASLWHRLYWVKFYVFSFVLRNGTLSTSSILLILLITGLYSAHTLQGAMEPHFTTSESIQGLRSLLLAVGAALIGATAIAFSLVVFAMQVNVDRMPHGMFRRLSSDKKLLGSFAGTFFIAFAIASLSLIADRPRLAVTVFSAVWGTVCMGFLLLYSYRRALFLINPLQQLNFIFSNTRKGMQTWAHRGKRASPLFETIENSEYETNSSSTINLNAPLATYYQVNSHWTEEAQRAILHSVSFAKRYAERGDHEVSDAALQVIVNINAVYIQAKGKTFFPQHPFANHPLATDGFINNTLEHLRQIARIAVARGDEQQIEKALNAMANLVHLYMSIDYSSEYSSKFHAHLASTYLSDAVQSVIAVGMVDVLMEGLRLMGQSARLFIISSKPNDIQALIKKISLVACTGIAKEDHRPVTLTGMEQLAILTVDLIRTKNSDISFAVKDIKSNVSLIAKLYLAIPDTPLSNIHSTYLGPYYSLISANSLLDQLTILANAVVEADAENQDARKISQNFEHWAETLHQTEKELFLAAIEKRSHFTFDIIHWIAHVTKLLLTVSNASACGDHTRDELRKHSIWLVALFSWVPDDQDAISFAENFQMTETLFEISMDAYHRECYEVSEKTRGCLFSWAFKAGKYHTGWAILENSLCGLALLALRDIDPQAGIKLEGTIEQHLLKDDSLNQEIRDRTAREIRRTAAELFPQGYATSRIERAMDEADHEKLRPLLNNIAELLSPNTAKKP